jgi:hypothetical protein
MHGPGTCRRTSKVNYRQQNDDELNRETAGAEPSEYSHLLSLLREPIYIRRVLTSLRVAVKGEIQARGCGLSLCLYNQWAKHPLIIVVLHCIACGWCLVRGPATMTISTNHTATKDFFPSSTQPENRAIDKQLSPKVPSTFS